MKSLLLITVIALLTGCSSMGVEPWERDLLAKDSMQLAPDYFDNFYDEHIYFRKHPVVARALVVEVADAINKH